MTLEIGAIAGLQHLWAETMGHPDVCLAVLDGPVYQTHPSVRAARLRLVETMASGNAGTGLAAQHGTHVTSITFGTHDGP